MKKLYFAILLFSLQSFIYSQPFEWQWQNSKPVGNALYDIQALSSTKVIAFGTASMVINSTDAGETWQSSYIDASRRDIWGSYFINPDTGLVVGAGGLIMKTTNGGSTWVSKPSNTTNILYDIEFYDANNGIACGAAGTIDRTTDGGETWTLSTATSATTNYKVSIVSSSVVYVGSANTTGRLIKSNDFGLTFSNATPTQVTQAVYGINILNATNYWVIASSGIVATNDGGTTWALQSAAGGWINYDVKFINSTNGFVVDQKGAVWSTTNTGTTWTSTQLSTIKQLRAVGYNSGNLFVVGNCGNIYKSTDNGGSWTAKYTTATQEQIRRILFKDDNNGLAGDGVGVLLQTTNGGQTWTSLYNLGHQVYSISMPTSSTWYVGCDAGFYYKTTNAGASFSALTFPAGGAGVTFWNTSFADSLIGYAGGSSGKFFKTTDGGSSWTDISTLTGFTTNVIYDIALINKDTFFISGLGAKLAKTTNGGTSFSPLAPGVTGAFFAVKFKNPSLGLIAGGSLALSRTTDAGATWTPITLPAGPLSNASIWGIAYSNDNVWISTINGDVLYSTDNGATWTNGKKPNTNTLYYMAVSNNNLWISGTEGNIIKGYANPFTLTLNFKALIEAMYVAGGETAMTITPNVTVELHDAVTLAVVESKTATLSTAGVGTFNFTTAVNGTPYYIGVKSLNTVETWSSATQSFSGGALSYDFTTGVGQAYTDGSMAPLALHTNYCIYSGDVNQDGIVSGDDFTGVDNDNSAFTYNLVNDVNGDGIVSGDDFTFIDNNNSNFVGRQVPPGAPAHLVKRGVNTHKSSVK